MHCFPVSIQRLGYRARYVSEVQVCETQALRAHAGFEHVSSNRPEILNHPQPNLLRIRRKELSDDGCETAKLSECRCSTRV